MIGLAFLKFIDAAIVALQDRRKRTMVVALGVGNIMACNAVGPYNKPRDPAPQVSSLVIADTSKTVRSPAILVPTENNGSFSISWKQSSGTSYTTTAYLSLGSTPSTSDIELFQIFVSDPTGPIGSSGNPVPTKTCVYAADNTINCGVNVDIKSLLTTLPKSAYIILRGCSFDAICVNVSYPVTLQ